jgi:hypothetical protein
MDPVTAFGAAGTAFALAELAAEVFISVFQYCRNVKEAPAHAEALRNELQNLSDLLDSLTKNLATSPLNPLRAKLLSTPSKELEKSLLHLRDRVTGEKNKRRGKTQVAVHTKRKRKVVGAVTKIQGRLDSGAECGPNVAGYLRTSDC